MRTLAPSTSGWERSTSTPSSSAATAAAASWRPMPAASSAIVVPAGTLRADPSGNKTVISLGI